MTSSPSADWSGLAVPQGVPLRVNLTIAPSFWGAFTSDARMLGIFGPVRTGKTTAALNYAYLHIQVFAPQYPGKYIRWAYVRNQYKSARGTGVKTLLEHFPPPQCGWWNEQRATYTVRLPRGLHGEIVAMGLDEPRDVGHLLSQDLSGFILDEPAGGLDDQGRVVPAIPEMVYRGLIPRLSHPMEMFRASPQHLRGIVIGNPPSTAHWAFREFRPDLPQPRDGKYYGFIPREESPLPMSFYEDLIRRYGGPSSPDTRRNVYGEWLPALVGGWTWSMVPEVDFPSELPDVVVATLDPATGARAGDFTALVVAGVEANGDATVLHLRVGRPGPETIVEWVFEAVARFPTIAAFGIEAVGFQAWLEPLIRREMERRDVTVPLIPLKRDTGISKGERIQYGLGFRLAERRLRRTRGLDPLALAEWQEELERFGGDDRGHDDVLDALADIDQVAIAAPAPLRMWGGEATAKPVDNLQAEEDRRQRGQAEAGGRTIENSIKRSGAWFPGE